MYYYVHYENNTDLIVHHISLHDGHNNTGVLKIVVDKREDLTKYIFDVENGDKQQKKINLSLQFLLLLKNVYFQFFTLSLLHNY